MFSRLLFAFAIGAGVGSVTAAMVALVMVTFGIASTPNWSLGVWFLWSLAWAVAGFLYQRKHPLL